MRRLIDTVVLVGALNPSDSLHKESQRHFESLAKDSETFLPVSSAFEFDLVLKGRRYTAGEREQTLEWLAHSVSSSKLISNSVSSLRGAVGLQERGIGYFDSMIASLALETDSVVVTRDKEISRVAKTIW